MDKERLIQLATAFAEEMRTSEELRAHVAEHQRRSQRARALLAPERIPTLSEDELRELFFDSDSYSFFTKKEWRFNQDLKRVGLEGLREALLELITRAERGLTPEDLKAVWRMGGLGTLLSTELLCYRFPDRYWTYSPNVTLPAFQMLGLDVKAGLPRGQKSDPYVYLALREPMDQVVAALQDVGLPEAGYSVADIFLLWRLHSSKALTPQQLAEILRVGERTTQTLAQAKLFLEQIATLLQERVGELETKVGTQEVRKDKLKKGGQHLSAASFTLSRDLLPAKVPGKAHPLNLSIFLLPNQLWWGVYAWASQKAIENLRDAFDRLGLINPDEEVKVEAGTLWMPKEVWGGGAYFALGHEMTADQVAVQPDLSSLAATIAEDLAEYHERITPCLDELHRMMSGEAFARKIIESLLPEPDVRESCLTAFAGSIIQAHQLGANKWGVTLHRDRVRLNVGRVVACTLHENRIWLDLDAGALSEEDRAALEHLFDPEGAYKSIPSSMGISIPPESLPDVLPTIQDAHFPLIEEAARMVKQLPRHMREAHSPGVIAYLRNYLGRRIPEPRYDEMEFPSVELRAVLNRSLTSQGLYFTSWQVATFYTALQTKGFVILSGISGTGKTKLAQHFAALLSQPTGGNWLFVPVRPDWRDSKSLLGYYNPLTGTYEWTPFLRFLLRAERSYRIGDGLAWFLLLDEMNLAHVEYYFADLLSVLESGRDAEGWTREPLRFDYPDEAKGNLPPRELHLSPNLYVIGTVNVDETTRAFSPKVLDRAFTLELTEADFSAYPPRSGENLADLDAGERQALLDNFTFGGRFARIDKQVIAEYVEEHPEVRTRLRTLSDQLRPYELHFGYRVFDEIVSFLVAARHNGLYDGLGGAEAAFDAAVLMKVLPKFHGSRSKLEAPLKAVLAWCVDPDTPEKEAVNQVLREVEQSSDLAEALAQLPHNLPALRMRETAQRVQRMLWELYTTGFAAFG